MYERGGCGIGSGWLMVFLVCGCAGKSWLPISGNNNTTKSVQATRGSVIVCKGWRVEGRVESGYMAVGLGLDGSVVSSARAGEGDRVVLYLVLFGVYV
jgi:hypothetical protein